MTYTNSINFRISKEQADIIDGVVESRNVSKTELFRDFVDTHLKEYIFNKYVKPELTKNKE